MIYFNVTTSMRWRGAPVGIVRTEIEFAKRILENAKNVKLLNYASGSFSIVEANDYLRQLDNNRYNNERTCIGERTSTSPLNFCNYSKRQALKLLANSIYCLSPRFARRIEEKLMILARKIVLSYLEKGRYKIKKNKIDFSLAPAPASVRFDIENLHQEDVFISMGLDWDSGIAEKLFQIKKKGAKIVSVCYDTIACDYPQFVANASYPKIIKEYFFDILESAEKVGCISKCSQADFLRFAENTGSRLPETFVFPLGSDIDSAKFKISEEEISESIRKLGDKKYILYVSTIERRKNHQVLYQAYRRLGEQNKLSDMPILVFVGMTGWGVNDLLNDIRLDPVVKEKIILTGRVNESELAFLYRNCRYTVFPSLYEGYALGIVESLAFGKMVLASRKGAIPEVGNDYLMYIDDALSVNEWAEALLRLETDTKLVEEKEKKIRDSFRPITWDDSYRVFINKIDDVIGMTSNQK